MDIRDETKTEIRSLGSYVSDEKDCEDTQVSICARGIALKTLKALDTPVVPILSLSKMKNSHRIAEEIVTVKYGIGEVNAGYEIRAGQEFEKYFFECFKYKFPENPEHMGNQFIYFYNPCLVTDLIKKKDEKGVERLDLKGYSLEVNVNGRQQEVVEQTFDWETFLVSVYFFVCRYLENGKI